MKLFKQVTALSISLACIACLFSSCADSTPAYSYEPMEFSSTEELVSYMAQQPSIAATDGENQIALFEPQTAHL